MLCDNFSNTNNAREIALISLSHTPKKAAHATLRAFVADVRITIAAGYSDACFIFSMHQIDMAPSYTGPLNSESGHSFRGATTSHCISHVAA